MSNLRNLKDDVDNLLREVVGDYKNDKKTKKRMIGILKLNTTQAKEKNQRRIEMVIKMDKSDEFIKSGKKLISEYDGANLKEDEEQKPELLNEEVLLS